LQNELVLGSTDGRRDWGHAREYVRAMWLMMQHDTADDYIAATGKAHSVQDFVEAAFAAVGLDARRFVKHDPSFDRPAEPVHLVGSPEKIARQLGWSAQITFEQLVREMIDAELRELDAGL
jgi:GDPmannose 4,6-dehydratase